MSRLRFGYTDEAADSSEELRRDMRLEHSSDINTSNEEPLINFSSEVSTETDGGTADGARVYASTVALEEHAWDAVFGGPCGRRAVQ